MVTLDADILQLRYSISYSTAQMLQLAFRTLKGCRGRLAGCYCNAAQAVLARPVRQADRAQRRLQRRAGGVSGRSVARRTHVRA